MFILDHTSKEKKMDNIVVSLSLHTTLILFFSMFFNFLLVCLCNYFDLSVTDESYVDKTI